MTAGLFGVPMMLAEDLSTSQAWEASEVGPAAGVLGAALRRDLRPLPALAGDGAAL